MKFRVGFVVGLQVAATMLATAGPAPASTFSPPANVLERPLPVNAAMKALGARADAVARSGESSLDEWTKLGKDKTAWVDRTGRLFFVEPTAAIIGADALTASAAPLPYDQTFLLHSNPTATRKIYLDFTGHDVTGTGWNNSYTSGAAFAAEPYSSDATPTAFSNAEMDQIQATWRMVAEDYAPFDVDVTTEDPGAAGINRSSSTDVAFGSRVVVTSTNTIYSSCSCGGIAYVGTIDSTGATHDYYQPAFVFTRGVGNGAKNIAEAASHEAGHNLGLSHDGTATVGYYTGHGAWAPIMGVGYSKPVAQWSRGEYAGANQAQDDFVVAGQNAIPLRLDDFGGAAAPSPAGASPVSIAGVIHNRTDEDAFVFTTAGGPVSFTATPAAFGANLDIRLTLIDAAGAVVATNDPAVAVVNSSSATGLDASVSATLTAGTYRVVVDGVGFGDPLNTGYSDYGSLGVYLLSGTYSVSSVPNVAPVAVAAATPTSGVAPLAVTYSGLGSSDSDGAIVGYSWAFSDGTTSTSASPTKTYTVAGSYLATLTVTDNAGATATSTVTVTVNPALVTTIKVQTISMTTAVVGGRREARAVVKVTDQNGVAVSGVTVTGAFSGAVSRSVSGTTSSAGTVTLISTRTRSTSGTFTFTIGTLTKTGTTYAPASNLVSSASIAF